MLGYLDDLLLIPLGIALAIRLIPPPVMEACRAQADDLLARKPVSRGATAVIITLWALCAGGLIWYLLRLAAGG